MSDAVVRLSGVDVWFAGRDGARQAVLRGVDLEVRAGERWVLLGPNGAGKSTLLAIAGAFRHPSRGAAEVLGARLGRVDVRTLRARIGYVEARHARELAFWPRMTLRDVVLTGADGSLMLMPHRLPAGALERAEALLARLGVAALAGRLFEDCSEGERKRALLARALMPRPALLVLDEPAAGLDLPGREWLLAALDGLAAGEPELASIVVTHHLEDVPSSTTHALLLREGGVVAAGPVRGTLTDEHVSACFGAAFTVSAEHGRYRARLVNGRTNR